MAHNYFREPLDLSSEVENLICLMIKGGGGGGWSAVTYVHDVPPVRQQGPMCGVVALTMAAQLLTKVAQTPPKSCHAMDKIHPESILEYAVHNGLSKQGEVFSTDDMERITTDHLHLQAHVATMEDALLDLLVDVVLGQRSVVVPYDADKDHTPCLARGHRAHWCLLVGVCLVVESEGSPLIRSLLECCQQNPNNYAHHIVQETCVKSFTQDLRQYFDPQKMKQSLARNQIHVFARHGKTSHLGMWSLRALIESNGNLVEVDPQRSNTEEYVIPKGALKDGLRKKVIFVTK